MPHRVLIVDDQLGVRQGLRALISAANEWTVCGEAVDGREAIEKANILKPDFIIMDISMPRMNGIEAAQIIRREVPHARVLILSQNDPEIVAREAAVANAHGFLAKNDAATQLLTLMKTIIAA